MKSNFDEGASLYVHIPFCRQKCLYCDFPSYSGLEDMMDEYIDALIKELKSIKYSKINTIFIGGGTPTYLSSCNLEKLLSCINSLKWSQDIEFTVEGNPGTFTYEKLKLLHDAGVNRLSMGLQAWQNSILRTLGRIHDLNTFLNGFEEARHAGFNNINVDLMFGVPDQSIADWEETLTNVTKLSPEHISCYSLIIEEGTPFYKLYNCGKLSIPDEDTERNMYGRAVDFLTQSGYSQYEISNFSKPFMECRHNIIYWELKPYIGCGAGAHSYYGGKRYQNTSLVEDYITRMNTEGAASLNIHKNTRDDDIEEFMFMGLRMLKGISISEFNKKFSMDIFDIYKNQLEKFLREGLLIRDDDRIFLSRRALDISNSIMCEFILTSYS
jgi:oxygen-independent coproporphyrinogen III oxidase